MGNWFSNRFSEQKRIIIQGLDAAGKTTLLYKMRLGAVVTTIPTIGFNLETIDINGISIQCWDIGGRGKIRPLYRHYYQNSDGIVFVIDSNDRERLDEALDELVRYLLLEDELRNTVVMVMANKQDLPNAMSAQEIEDAMEKKFAVRHCTQTIFFLPCSVVQGEGLYEAFDLFTSQLKLKKSGKAKAGLISQSEMTTKLQEMDKDKQSKSFSFNLKSLFRDPVDYFKALF